MFELKTYQQNALSALEGFLEHCRDADPAAVYADVARGLGAKNPAYHDIFNGAPCACLKVPTGGGKTIIAASAIKVIDDAYLQTGAPVTLWLTPSEAITTQTLKALQDPAHPYRQAIDGKFQSVKVVGIADIATLTDADFGHAAIIVVATIQTFNIEDKKQRNVYAFREDLEPFFKDVPSEKAAKLARVNEDDVKRSEVLSKSLGRINCSVANLLTLYDPIIIVDEAHNNNTDRFFRTLNGLHPSVVLELTATPLPSRNNVIYHVSAWELKTEDMVKLPIVLEGHDTSWDECLTAAYLQRRTLSEAAAGENDYVRPILLVQACRKGLSPSPEEVKDFLVNRLDVRENRIAIATGSTKDLNGVDLMDRKCPIEVVITINALKEGWDCPFAYVLCSLQDMKSAKDVEQLIGRIMRMPYAKRRLAESLNKAYATVLSSSTYDVAESLRSNLVDSMGFSRQMAAEMIEEKKDEKPGHSIFRDDHQPSLFEDDQLDQTKRPDIHLKMTDDPQEVLRKAGLEGKAEVIRTRPSATDEKVRVVSFITPKALSPEEVNRLTEALKKESKKVRESNEIALTNYQLQHRVKRAKRLQDEVRVIEVPCFCFVKDGHVEEVGTNLESWVPLVALGVSPQIDFTPRDTVRSREVDVNEAGKVVAGAVQNGSRTINPRLLDVGYSEDDLVKALAKDLARPDVTLGNMVRFVGACVRSILNDGMYSVERLVQNRVQLKKLFANLLEKCREIALRNGIEQQLDLVCEAPEHYHFHFEPGKYEPRNIYEAGSTGKDFEKHFYPQIHDLHERTPGGVEAEEYRCACVIDDHPAVKTWVRNVDRSKYAFRLALTDGGYFYPDFVALLTDGRILVVEYKGENLISNDDSKLKNRIGKLWAKASNGKALFAMVTKTDELGNDLYEQLDRVIRGE